MTDKQKTLTITLLCFVISFFAFLWTAELPVVGDGLMHMNDNTDLSFINIFRSFFTFNGLNKPSGSYLLGFHRPIFDEIIIEVLKKATGYNVYLIRTITVIFYAVSTVATYFLGLVLFDKQGKAILLAVFATFSICRFPGLYELGLSFSVWLFLFFVFSLLFTVKYIQNKKILS